MRTVVAVVGASMALIAGALLYAVYVAHWSEIYQEINERIAEVRVLSELTTLCVSRV